MPRKVSREELLEAIEGVATSDMKSVLVAIDGRGGAGKTALAEWLESRLAKAAVVHIDDFGHPGAVLDDWDWDRLRTQVLEPVTAGESTRFQINDWSGDRGEEWVELEAGGLVIVEGVSVLRSELGEPWHMTVWVESPFEIRLARGVERDGESMRDMWLNFWMPEENRYIEAQKPQERVDYVVLGHGP